MDRIAVSALKGWIIKALDFKHAYLNTQLSEEIWLKLLSGGVVQACKSAYGLRPSGMKWWSADYGKVLRVLDGRASLTTNVHTIAGGETGESPR